MICKNCLTSNSPESNKCSKCGHLLKERNNKKSKLHKFGGLLAVLLLGIILFIFNIGAFNPKYETPVDRTSHPIIYTKNNTLGIKPITKSQSILSDYLLANPASPETAKVFLAENGSGLYFLENYDEDTQTGSLFASYNGKTKVPISSKAYHNIQVSQNGKYVLFIENLNLNNLSGSLYIYEKGKEKYKISDNIVITEFKFNDKNSNIYYIESSDSTTSGDLYIQKIGGDREKIDTNVSKIVNVSKASSIVYLKDGMSKKHDLYYWQNGKASKQIGENVSENMIYSSKISDNLYYCADNVSNTSYSLYFKETNKNSKIVDTSVLSPICWDANYQNIIYTKNFDNNTFASDIFIKRRGKQPIKLATNSNTTQSSVASSYDYKTIVYISDSNPETGLGNLYIKKYGFFTDKQAELISENVSSFVFSKSGDVILYAKGKSNSKNNDLYLYNNKKHTLITENIQSNHYYLTNDYKGIFYLVNYNQLKDSGNLFYKKVSAPTSEGVKINSDVSGLFYPRGQKQVIYTKNYSTDSGESELYLWKGKKSELIDKGVINVLFE